MILKQILETLDDDAAFDLLLITCNDHPELEAMYFCAKCDFAICEACH